MQEKTPQSFRAKLRIPLSWIVLLLLSVVVDLSLSTPAPAQTGHDSNTQTTDILNTISNYVMTTCSDPATESKKEDTGWGIKGEAELNKILRKIASLGGEAWYEERTEKSNGLLQRDLPEVIKHVIDCRRALTELLLKTFLPEGKYVAAEPQSGITNTPIHSPFDAPGAGTRRSVEPSIEHYTAYVASGSSNNPELNAPRLLQKALEDRGFRVLPAQERANADIIVEISVAKSDHIDCHPEQHGMCSIEVNAYYQAYWSKDHKEILPPETLTEPKIGKPTIATNDAAEGVVRKVAAMVSQKINS